MKTRRPGAFLPVLEVAKINLKHNMSLSVMVSVLMILLTPVIFGTSNLDSRGSAVPMELFLSLLGIVLLTPVFQPEQNAEIHDVVSSKYVDIVKIYAIRQVCAFVMLAGFIGISGIYMKMRGCDTSLVLVAGTVANALFLGGLGMMTSALCNNTIIAYMIPLVFYMLNYGAGAKLGNFYLFSMMAEDSGPSGPKRWLFLGGVALAILSLMVKWAKRRL